MVATSTSFKPGQNGNPGGRRPAEFKQFRDFLRTYSDEAAQELVDRALGRPNENGVRDRSTASEKAFELMLAYMYCRPPQAVTGEGGEGPVDIIIRRVIIDPNDQSSDA